ncbi:RNA polymerase subunit sigma-24 [Massilia sp. Root351]|jgi:RNA polymerase sigma factor (sigma-70 family)|uniref:RNA polymerase sigma factor n=1 Tax=Massilia sp. Root351 TaxID=1736522 RepID=UPI00070BBEEF|nr:sigma-70 family RNA polymerase sigma factor [Massilia sp. Root351]KQV90015.1 RNA polymerase subunit sigma-24 [Massilia sp. Root351]
MALSDHHLPVLDAAHRGDPAALAQLLRLCQPDIRRYAQRSCLISDVDDAVQEALLVLSRRLEAVRMLAAFSGWLFKVVQRACRRLGRAALNYDPYGEEHAEQWLAAQDTAGLRRDLVNTLESLPADYREVILLRDFAEMSIAEIAAELGLSVPAAKSRLHRARQMAREYLIA